MLKKTVQQGRSEAHGAMKKERTFARRRDGEPAVSLARRILFYPARPELLWQLMAGGTLSL